VDDSRVPTSLSNDINSVPQIHFEAFRCKERSKVEGLFKII